LTASNAGEYVRIEMPGRIHRLPPRTYQVAWMQNYRAADASPSAVEEKLFDRGLLDSVIAERMSRILFSRRSIGGAPMHPHRAAVKQQGATCLQRGYELLGAGRSKADEIDDCIRLERRDARAECPGGVLGRSVDVDALDGAPRGMRHIRLALSTAGDDYLVPRVDEPRDEERHDVTGPADDDNSPCGHKLDMIQ